MSFSFCPPTSSEEQVHPAETLYDIFKPRANLYLEPSSRYKPQKIRIYNENIDRHLTIAIQVFFATQRISVIFFQIT